MISFAPIQAANPPIYSFNTLKPVSQEVVQAKLKSWLTELGKYDEAQFSKIWSHAQVTTHDKAVESIMMSSPELIKIFDQLSNPEHVPTIELPAVLKQFGNNSLVSSTLTLEYAKRLSLRRSYEEVLQLLQSASPEEVVDPASFYFHKSVAEYALMRRESAIQSLTRLLQDVVNIPDRYRVVGTLLLFEVENWPKNNKDLSNIARLMDNSGRRLDLARAGETTQEIQKKIVFRLDEQIKQLENQLKQQQRQQQQAQAGSGDPNEGACPPGTQPGQAAGDPNRPADDSRIAQNSGKGIVDEKKLRHYEEVWGKLPEAERKKVVQDITRDLPPKYRPMIEEYFRALNRMHGNK